MMQWCIKCNKMVKEVKHDYEDGNYRIVKIECSECLTTLLIHETLIKKED